MPTTCRNYAGHWRCNSKQTNLPLLFSWGLGSYWKETSIIQSNKYTITSHDTCCEGNVLMLREHVTT